MGRTIAGMTVLLAALAVSQAWAQDEPPAVVGRISAVEGRVTLDGDGDPDGPLLNWPVTTSNHISTAVGSRAEFRVGSTAVRLDGDTDLEITQLDEDYLRLRLNYGSAIVRIKNPDFLRGFELSTPQARVTLLQPGVVRIDADRIPDTSQVSVQSGAARVDGAGSSLTVNAGRRVDITPEDVRTGLATRDGFDSWAAVRDQRDDAAVATRYIPAEVTGYETLDEYGTWQDSQEYGTLWIPRNVASDWAPYRDGRWIWLAPWGWTWIDNAPWGYAPSHYGRWVQVNSRWCWAPGRVVGRPVWAPALVGWVGGDHLRVNHGGRPGPGLGWFPLSPRERYVPPYKVSVDRERRLTWTHNGKPLPLREERRDRGYRDGVTVLPREQFDNHRYVPVGRNTPRVTVSPTELANAPLVRPPAPQVPPGRGDWRDRNGRPNAGQGVVQTQNPAQANPQQQPGRPGQNTLSTERGDNRGQMFEDNGRRRFSTREQEQNERAQAQREQALRGQAQREQGQRTQTQLEQTQREQLQREQGQREQAQRDQAQRDQAQREQGQREQWQRDQAQREQGQRERFQREQAQREQGQREQAQREQAQREQGQREQAQREQSQREQGQREQAQREQQQREQQMRAQREQGQREQAMREQQMQQAQREQAQREQQMRAQQAQQAQQAQREQAQRQQQQQQPREQPRNNNNDNRKDPNDKRREQER
ncbi:DUF6600 domain-containing protein [Oxalobacteraceae bacterium A2-2]